MNDTDQPRWICYPALRLRIFRDILKKPKEKKEASRGDVYKIKCKDCDSVCAGQTSRALKTRVK